MPWQRPRQAARPRDADLRHRRAQPGAPAHRKASTTSRSSTAPDWCNIVPLTRDGEVVMVRQQRHGIGEETLELPGGMVDPEDASPLEAARARALEETGYRAASWSRPASSRPTRRCRPIAAGRSWRATWSSSAQPRARRRRGHRRGAGAVRANPRAHRARRDRHALVVVAFAYALGLRAPALKQILDLAQKRPRISGFLMSSSTPRFGSRPTQVEAPAGDERDRVAGAAVLIAPATCQPSMSGRPRSVRTTSKGRGRRRRARRRRSRRR